MILFCLFFLNAATVKVDESLKLVVIRKEYNGFAKNNQNREENCKNDDERLSHSDSLSGVLLTECSVVI